MIEVDAGVMAQAAADWEQAGHGEKGVVLAQWLPVLGIDRSRFYREIRRWGRSPERRARADRGVRKIPHLEEIAAAVVQVKNRPTKGVRRGRLEDALKYAIQEGIVPPAARETAAALPLGTIYRVAREKGWLEQARRVPRFQANYANQVHQFDCSFSEHFMPVRQEGGEWILKLRPARQKNKEKAEGLRVIACGLTDDFSGYRLARYAVAKGESAAVGIGFLQWAWARVEEHLPFRGMPDILYMDNGPLSKLSAFKRFCEETAGVEIQTHEPERSQATGKVENNWRSMWKPFETPFFFNPAWKDFEITLTELNDRLAAFWRGWNMKPHRTLNHNRTAAWLTIMERGGPVDIDPGAWGTVFHIKKARLDDAGCFNYQGQTYEVREIHACEIRIFEGVLDRELVVEDLRDGKKYTPVKFEMLQWGEFRGRNKTELERLQEEDPGLGGPPQLSGAEAAGNVVPIRAREVRGQEDGGQRPEESGQWSGASGQQEEEPAAEIYGSPLEKYVAIRLAQGRGEELSPEYREYLTYFETEYKEQFELMREDVERRVRLAVIG